MRRILPWLFWTVGLVSLVPLLVLGVLLLAANTPPGRELLESAVRHLSSGAVQLEGLAGRFPDDFRLRRIAVADEVGIWFEVRDIALVWSPGRLFSGVAMIQRLTAGQVAIARLPAEEADSSGEAFSLPVVVDLGSLQVRRLELAPEVAGPFARALTIQGRARLVSVDEAEFDLSVRELGGEGAYQLSGRLEQASLQAHFSAHESDHGAIASAAGLTALGPVALEASLRGPRAEVRADFDLTAGGLSARAEGTLDLMTEGADLRLTASASAMQPRADLSWQGVTLNATLLGPFAHIAADGSLVVDGLRAGESGVRRMALDWRGEAGQVNAQGSLEGLRVPGPKPAVLANAPLILEVGISLDAADRPVTFSVKHPLLSAQGRVRTAPVAEGEVSLNLPDLGPLAEMGGMKLSGEAQFTVNAVVEGEVTRVDTDGKVSIIGGESPVPALVGEDASLGASLAVRGAEVNFSRLEFRGKALAMNASGRLGGQGFDLSWGFELPDLRALAAEVEGAISARGKLDGPVDAFALRAEARAEMALQGQPRRPVSVKLQAQGLPDRPTASLSAGGVLAGSPLQLKMQLRRESGGALRIQLDQADWKSAHGTANVLLPKGATFPLGSLDMRMTRLADLGELIGQPLSGTLQASLDTTAREGSQQARLQLEGHALGVGDSIASEHVRLAMTVANPMLRPVTDGFVHVEGLTAGGVAGNLQLDFTGPDDGLDLRLRGKLENLMGAGLELQGSGQLDRRHSKLTVSHLESRWKGETLQLLVPLRIAFAEGLSLDRLRLGLGKAELEARGRIAPAMDLTVRLGRLPANLLTLFQPNLKLAGQLQGDARLAGSPSRLTGDIALAAEGLRWQDSAGAGLPAAGVKVTARLNGNAARIDGQVRGGQNLVLSLSGQVPMAESGLFDLRGTGTLDLMLLDPILAGDGRRARGRMTLDASVAGTLREPRMSGRAQLQRGEWQDYAQGMHLTDLTALLQVEGDRIRLVRLQGRAGEGTLQGQGSLAVLSPGLPIDLSIGARRAGLLSSERLTVNLNADLSLKGWIRGDLKASGNVRINRAEIRIPERMPSNIAVLDVREAGAPPPPPPEPGPHIALDLKLDAPREIFVRGRGLDAELGGSVHLKGTGENPQPLGRFEMRRGQFTLAGQTLTFKQGTVGFDGGRLTDPSLNFLAQTVGDNVTANLGVTGTANRPKITLSSVPDLPQDEVLAQLLFGRGKSGLSIFELIQIASAVASLAGVTSGVDSPLESIRSGLGLDRLTVGGGSGPTLEAGRYIAPGIYVGAKQGTSASSTQGTVQIDVGRGLKLEASVGAGSSTTGSSAGTSSVGVIYQYEY